MSSCSFCSNPTPHVCWTAEEASCCGNYATARAELKSRQGRADAVERIIAAASRKQTAAEIEKRERKELDRLKRKYEKR